MTGSLTLLLNGQRLRAMKQIYNLTQRAVSVLMPTDANVLLVMSSSPNLTENLGLATDSAISGESVNPDSLWEN